MTSDKKLMEQPTSSMKIKSYFAASVEQAIQEARQELGTDAMLITSRRSSPETRSLGAYEVVFGLQAAPPRRRARVVPAADLSSELQNLRAQLQEIKSTLARRAAIGVSVVGSRRAVRGAGLERSGAQHCAGNGLGRGSFARTDCRAISRRRRSLCEPMPRSWCPRSFDLRRPFHAAGFEQPHAARKLWSSLDPPARAKPPR